MQEIMKFKLVQPLMIPVGPRLYRLVEEYTYHWRDVNGRINRIIVPLGTETDGATVPRIVWTVTGIRPDGLIRAAALVHDWIYVNDGNPPNGSHTIWMGTDEEFWELQNAESESDVLHIDPESKWYDYNYAWSHREADKLFHQMSLESGMDKFRATLAYWGVRVGGWWV